MDTNARLGMMESTTHGDATPTRVVAPTTLVTSRLLVRPWRRRDRAPFAALNADPEVVRYLPGALDRDASDALVDRIEAQFERSGIGLWAIERLDDGAFCGFVGLAPVSFEAPFADRLEVGWRLARDQWGHGIATEAARAALWVVFDQLRHDEVVSFTTVENRPSRAVMERIGLRHDPTADFDHPRLEPGHPLGPHVLYRRDREDWAADPDRGDAPIRIRAAVRGDEAFLRSMTYEAIWVPEGVAPPPVEIVEHDELAVYHRHFGRDGDVGAVAETWERRPVGAAWVRRPSAGERGYGWVDDTVPELTVAVEPGHRGRGIGTALLRHLLGELDDRALAGAPTGNVSLSVDPANPAIRLYERLEFVPVDPVAADGASVTMLRRPSSA